MLLGGGRAPAGPPASAPDHDVICLWYNLVAGKNIINFPTAKEGQDIDF